MEAMLSSKSSRSLSIFIFTCEKELEHVVLARSNQLSHRSMDVLVSKEDLLLKIHYSCNLSVT
jgi:hypothetical protein